MMRALGLILAGYGLLIALAGSPLFRAIHGMAMHFLFAHSKLGTVVQAFLMMAR